jgi:hypothetical protein
MDKLTSNVFKFLAKAKEELNAEDFKTFVAMNASISLGVIYAAEGAQFYREFLQGAVANPISLKFEKGTMQ